MQIVFTGYIFLNVSKLNRKSSIALSHTHDGISSTLFPIWLLPVFLFSLILPVSILSCVVRNLNFSSKPCAQRVCYCFCYFFHHILFPQKNPRLKTYFLKALNFFVKFKTKNLLFIHKSSYGKTDLNENFS